MPLGGRVNGRKKKMEPAENPRKWRYTWETLAHIPTLRLYLFTQQIKPLIQCKQLKVTLNLKQNLLLVTWIEEIGTSSTNFSLRIPVPKALIDHSSPVGFKALEDHIEVKLNLVLPIGHPLFMNFSSVLNISDDMEPNRGTSHFSMPQDLSVSSDLKYLSSQNKGDFYCKKCSTKLTKKSLRSFVEMPSPDWREVADNWFGTCCCSFGGISEKLVNRYANSFLFSESTCLLDASSAVVSNEDLAEVVIREYFDRRKENGSVGEPSCENNVIETVRGSGSNGGHCLFSEDQCKSISANGQKTIVSQVLDCTSRVDDNLSPISLEKERLSSNLENGKEKNVGTLTCTSHTISDLPGNVVSANNLNANDLDHCCVDKTSSVSDHDGIGCLHDTSATCSKDYRVIECDIPLKNQNALLNISLGNGFMIRNFNISKDVDWVEVKCPQCSSVLGAHPSASNTHAPADGGVRLFKCCTSTSLPVGESDDIFRYYTLQRTFINQLMENSRDELSFRTVVRDLTTRSPLLQIVLLNSDAWVYADHCVEQEDTVLVDPKTDLHPVVKVLFSDYSNASEVQSRMLKEWATKNQADEVFMLRSQVMDLIESLKSAMDSLPPSCFSMQGMSLSYIER